MNFTRWLMVQVVGWFLLAQPGGLGAEGAARPLEGPLIALHAPHARQYELALDEVELDWSGDSGAKTRRPAQSAAPIPGTMIVEAEGVRARVSVPPVPDPQDLLPLAAALKAANPGSQAHLVVYEPGLPKSQATRQLLTREVGLLMAQGVDPQGIFTGQPTGAIRPVPGVPDGYVVEASDPLAAVALADTLRQRPGVRSAYPLLKRTYMRR